VQHTSHKPCNTQATSPATRKPHSMCNTQATQYVHAIQAGEYSSAMASLLGHTKRTHTHTCAHTRTHHSHSTSQCRYKFISAELPTWPSTQARIPREHAPQSTQSTGEHMRASAATQASTAAAVSSGHPSSRLCCASAVAQNPSPATNWRSVGRSRCGMPKVWSTALSAPLKAGNNRRRL